MKSKINQEEIDKIIQERLSKEREEFEAKLKEANENIEGLQTGLDFREKQLKELKNDLKEANDKTKSEILQQEKIRESFQSQIRAIERVNEELKAKINRYKEGFGLLPEDAADGKEGVKNTTLVDQLKVEK